VHIVYINNIPLIIANIYNEPFPKSDMEILSDSEYSLNDVLKKYEDSSFHGAVYLSASPDRTWTQFTSRYILSEAAGGVVRNDNDELLVIYRKKFWDLPKGKLDYNESAESAAIREVKEECGLKSVVLEKPLIKTFHTYSEKNKFILKKTHWFTMLAEGNQILIPQTEEDIEKAKWMTKEKILDKVYSKTYLSIKQVLNEFFKTISNSA
jgi:8-oxo-dGTP pyrophosphatase MutT (NUDIX family)